MRNVHLVLTKEALDPARGKGAVAIVLDIIFATSSIVTALQAGARAVIPAMDLADAERIASTREPDSWILAGEHNANSFSGYRSYNPMAMMTSDMAGKDLIYATTNGTVALRHAAGFDRVYAACLRNGAAVVRHLLVQHQHENIVVVCSGSRGHFSLEDFHGAGYIMQCLRHFSGTDDFQFSDAALAAELAFSGHDSYQVIRDSRLGQLMTSRGLDADLRHVVEQDSSQIVGMLQDSNVIAV